MISSEENYQTPCIRIGSNYFSMKDFAKIAVISGFQNINDFIEQLRSHQDITPQGDQKSLIALLLGSYGALFSLNFHAFSIAPFLTYPTVTLKLPSSVATEISEKIHDELRNFRNGDQVIFNEHHVDYTYGRMLTYAVEMNADLSSRRDGAVDFFGSEAARVFMLEVETLISARENNPQFSLMETLVIPKLLNAYTEARLENFSKAGIQYVP